VGWNRWRASLWESHDLCRCHAELLFANLVLQLLIPVLLLKAVLDGGVGEDADTKELVLSLGLHTNSAPSKIT
jgi:hypothetical protein